MANSNTGLTRIIKAAGYSARGLRAAWVNEAAFRQELLLCLLLLPLGLWLGRTALEWALLLATLMLVLVAELLNSAVEALTDRVGVERHELSGRAKDMGSAAVFVAMLNVALVWGLVGWQRFVG